MHHVIWFTDDGETKVINGCLLCWFHHARVHSRGWSLEMDTRTRRVTVTFPDGRTRTSRPAGMATDTTDDPDSTRRPASTAIGSTAGDGAGQAAARSETGPPDEPDQARRPAPRNTGSDPPQLPGV